MKFFRQDLNALGKEGHFTGFHGDGAGFGLNDHALDAEEVAYIGSLHYFVSILQNIFLGENLDLAVGILNV